MIFINNHLVIYLFSKTNELLLKNKRNVIQGKMFKNTIAIANLREISTNAR